MVSICGTTLYLIQLPHCGEISKVLFPNLEFSDMVGIYIVYEAYCPESRMIKKSSFFTLEQINALKPKTNII